MTRQWWLISGLWLSVTCGAIVGVFFVPDDQAWPLFATLMAGSIALVSLSHVLRASVQNAVREQIYVAAGSFFILVIATVLTVML